MKCLNCLNENVIVTKIESIDDFSQKRLYGCNTCGKTFETIENRFRNDIPDQRGKYLIKYKNGNFTIGNYQNFVDEGVKFEVVTPMHSEIIYIEPTEVEWIRLGD